MKYGVKFLLKFHELKSHRNMIFFPVPDQKDRVEIQAQTLSSSQGMYFSEPPSPGLNNFHRLSL